MEKMAKKYRFKSGDTSQARSAEAMYQLLLLVKDTMCTSLDLERTDQNGRTHTIIENAVDITAEDPAIIAEAKEELNILCQQMETVINAIPVTNRKNADPEKSLRIFKDRYGLSGNGRMLSFVEIGKIHHMTREGARKAVSKILKNLHQSGIHITEEELSDFQRKINALAELVGLEGIEH
ncbi:MAG: hypothetical protein Q7K40_01145 [bacterium]|nr:hypothetical protein [bacterium]